ncbi:MAG: haloalkane dehalogenase [Pseudomonadota bacterium]
MNDSSHFGAPPRHVPVLDSSLAYREAGAGTPLIFLHGNPLPSRVWRQVLPAVAEHARCLAPDLIGMGDSGKPDIAYRFSDHARYLDAWFDALDLRDVVLVGYDWGGALAMDWAARHPERVRGLVAFETFLRPMLWSEWTPAGAELFRALRTPGVGEKMVLETNQFLARSLQNGVRRGLSETEASAYLALYAGPAARRPILQWTREIPIEGEPADVHALVLRYDAWLATSAVPKLLLSFERPAELQPSPTGSAAVIEWAREHAAALEVAELPLAGHHAPEDVPHEISATIIAWLARHAL